MFTGINESFAMMGEMLDNRTTTLRSRIMAAWNVVNELNFVDKAKVNTVEANNG